MAPDVRSLLQEGTKNLNPWITLLLVLGALLVMLRVLGPMLRDDTSLMGRVVKVLVAISAVVLVLFPFRAFARGPA